jgi:probable HAF family extracellular repeat protein
MTNTFRRRLAASTLVLGAAFTGTAVTGALTVPAHAAASGIATAYKLTLINAGTITGASTDVFGISSTGEVFGTGDKAGIANGFVLPAGAKTATFLGVPGNAAANTGSFPEMLNNNGDVVGSFVTNLSNKDAVEWPGGKPTPTDLQPLIDKAVGFSGGDGEDAVANGINDHGLIVVEVTVGNFAEGVTIQGSASGTLPGLPGGSGAAGSPNSNPIAVNNNGLIVGSAVDSAGNEVAAQWLNGKITDLGQPANSFQTQALAVNDNGLAVGASISHADGDAHALEFVNGQVIDLNVPGTGTGDAVAKAVNDSGVIVGSDGFGDAFAFDNGQSANLNTLIPAGSGVTLATANGINSNGVIVGTATVNGSGQTVGFELTPVA